MMNNNFETFVANLVSELQEFYAEYDPSVHVTTKVVNKANEVTSTGIVFNQDGSILAPCIYVNEIYNKYKEDPMEISVAKVVEAYEHAKCDKKDIVKYCSHFEDAKPFLTMRLYELEKNETWLKDKIYTKVNDFANVVYISYEDAAVAVTDSIVAMWNVDASDVIKVAFNNLSKVPVKLYSLEGFFLSGTQKNLIKEFELDKNGHYVLTNEDGAYGSALIGRKDLLSNISIMLHDDFYVLPSSIHEVLIIPASAGVSEEELKSMVKEVNQSEVSEQDFLSDKVQFYSKLKNKLFNIDRKYNLEQRAKFVRAMETIARGINDEEIFERWLMSGVADGDIDEETTDEDLEYYCEDDNFADLMTLFLRLMSAAKKSGGLYEDYVLGFQEPKN